MFGYHTYSQHPAVFVLPVHLEGRDWVVFSEGEEQRAVDETISKLQRYFCRPLGQPYDSMTYVDYFEHFNISTTCPISWRPAFPDRFPASVRSSPTSPGEDGLASSLTWPRGPRGRTYLVTPTMDLAPPGKEAFVSLRFRPQASICRLEMKYPNQKEEFYLRHLLLHFPKRSFEDCKRHNGRRYDTFEEATTAAGLLGKDSEADAVMEEMVALRYTGAQLRFVFLLLL